MFSGLGADGPAAARDPLRRGDDYSGCQLRRSPSIPVLYGGVEIDRVSRRQAVDVGTNRQFHFAAEEVEKFDAGVLVKFDFVRTSCFKISQKRVEFPLVRKSRLSKW